MTCTKSVILPVDVDDAFALVTQPERLRRWKAVSARVDLRAGGEYRFTINPGHSATGTIREVEPGRRLVLGWGWEDAESVPPDSSTVTITLEPVPEGTLVTLTHEGLSDEQEAMHAAGWDHYLGRLASAAAHGDAGPDEWAAIPDPMDELGAAEASLATLQRVARGLTDEDKPKSTPCSEFTCHDLAQHVLASMSAFGAMADVAVTDPGGSLEHRVATMGAEAIEAWRRRGLDGVVQAPPGGELPAAVAAGVMPMEFLLHAWDLARGSGQELVVADELVGYVHQLAEQVVPGARGFAFADEITPAADASPLQRLAAYAGRQPAA